MCHTPHPPRCDACRLPATETVGTRSAAPSRRVSVTSQLPAAQSRRSTVASLGTAGASLPQPSSQHSLQQLPPSLSRPSSPGGGDEDGGSPFEAAREGGCQRLRSTDLAAAAAGTCSGVHVG